MPTMTKPVEDYPTTMSPLVEVLRARNAREHWGGVVPPHEVEGIIMSLRAAYTYGTVVRRMEILREELAEHGMALEEWT